MKLRPYLVVDLQAASKLTGDCDPRDAWCDGSRPPRDCLFYWHRTVWHRRNSTSGVERLAECACHQQQSGGFDQTHTFRRSMWRAVEHKVAFAVLRGWMLFVRLLTEQTQRHPASRISGGNRRRLYTWKTGPTPAVSAKWLASGGRNSPWYQLRRLQRRCVWSSLQPLRNLSLLYLDPVVAQFRCIVVWRQSKLRNSLAAFCSALGHTHKVPSCPTTMRGWRRAVTKHTTQMTVWCDLCRSFSNLPIGLHEIANLCILGHGSDRPNTKQSKRNICRCHNRAIMQAAADRTFSVYALHFAFDKQK